MKRIRVKLGEDVIKTVKGIGYRVDSDDLEDLRDVYEAQDKEGLALWNNDRKGYINTEREI